MQRDQMNIVIVGHVDHGKSTVIGRLLADTGSLPEGKLEQVKATCAKNAKPFEYAFLLDALKDEQAQGITIDAARCFFKTSKRDYIILDAPGHIEFLKNMVTGAARAETALLVIDASEGIQENSRRHGHMVSLLGIRQVVVLVNKMDIVKYSEKVFREIEEEYRDFLAELNVSPVNFIPVSAREGDNIVHLSKKMPWYQGYSIKQQLDQLKKQEDLPDQALRFPVQDVYKFTEGADERRIIAGTIETGSINTGDEVVFLPSRKESTIKTIEEFNVPAKKTAYAKEAIGFTLTTQIYIRSGELMVKKTEKIPNVSTRFKANIFWMGKSPMIKNKRYKIKLAAARTTVKLVDILNCLDASDLSSVANKQVIEKHDVCECILETTRPVAFDLADELENTSRFAIVDNYEISGGGIVLNNLSTEESMFEKNIREREFSWEKSAISLKERADSYKHRSKFVLLTGPPDTGKQKIARALERRLFENNYKVYYLGKVTMEHGLDSDISSYPDSNDEYIRRLGELARIMTDAGQIFITTISDADDFDIRKLKLLNEPNEILVVNTGSNIFNNFKVDLDLDEHIDVQKAVLSIEKLLKEKEIILEYYL
ncbi:MAG: GTP-binding protein [bacterium]|nr:GTP-binding protein [bacterium]